MIDADRVVKSYGELTAVDGVSFTVQAGEAFGLLGPNGAGKTTLIGILAGIHAPDAGSVRVGDGDPAQTETRRSIGVAPQSLAIYDELTGAENLRLFGELYGVAAKRVSERVDWALEFSGLTDRRKNRVKTYSGGMKRRLNLACALVHEPEVLICDEPTVGVDPQSRNHIFDNIETLRSQGTTLLYTTHYMEEAERLCDRIAIMDHGRLLAIDSVSALVQAHGGASLVFAELVDAPREGHGLPGTLDGKKLRVETDRPFEVVAELDRAGVEVARLRVDQPDLERVFLELTGRSLRDE